MIDFDAQTAVTGSNGAYRATIHPEPSTPMGPYGAYVAGIGVRAAGAHSDFDRPASVVCHYLRPSKFGQVELAVETLRQTKRAQSIRVSMKQEEQTVVEMFVWTAADLTGLEHELAMPEVPPPQKVKPWEEIVVQEWDPPPIWEEVLEGRPIFDPLPRGEPPWRESDFEPGPPLVRNWLRIQNQSAFDDPFAEAARLLLPIDMSVSNAAYRPHMGKDLWLPTMELTAAFHDLASGSTWMLADCESPIGRGGLMWADAKIWSEQGRLLATGAQLMLQRQRPLPESSA